MPSAFSRVVLIIPLAAAFAERQGLVHGSRGFNGVVVIAVCSTYLTSFSILTTGYPNLVITGIVENLFAVQISFGHWFAMNFLVFGLMRLGLVFLVVYMLFPAQLPKNRDPNMNQLPQQPLQQNRKKYP